MENDKSLQSSQDQSPTKKPNKFVSGFMVFTSEDGTTYKAEIIKVKDFRFDDQLFTGAVEGVLEPTKY